MPEPTAAVDWANIQRRWCAGESALSIARTLQPLPDGRQLTRQAIENRAKREHWLKGVKPATLAVAKSLPTMQRRNEVLADPSKATPGERVSVAKASRTPESAARLLELIASGLSEEKAAKLCQIGYNTVQRWKEDDRELAERIDHAKRQAIITRLNGISEAGDRGDWKAHAWYLERSPLTRDEFGSVAAGKSGPTVNIQLNVGRSDTTQPIDITDPLAIVIEPDR